MKTEYLICVYFVLLKRCIARVLWEITITKLKFIGTLIISFLKGKQYCTFILHLFRLLVYLSVLFYTPFLTRCFFTNLIISSASQNSWYLYSYLISFCVITRTSTWLCFFYLLSWINFGWTKKNWLERHLNLQPPDWRASALPTELTSPILAVSLFCQYLCLGGRQSEVMKPYTAL